jgi:hypothetical protein
MKRLSYSRLDFYRQVLGLIIAQIKCLSVTRIERVSQIRHVLS